MKTLIARIARSATVAALFAAAPAFAASHGVSHIFLVQNSGWMDPFFTDPSSQYKPLVTELVMAATQPGDLMVLASFKQSLPGAPTSSSRR